MGVAAALYHAWSEKAFVTNFLSVRFAPLASFFGVPYWLFGVIWFPLILVTGIFVTRMGSSPLKKDILILLTLGNIFTGYLWYLDILVVKAYNPEYIILYATNYALTGLVVYQNWSNDIVHGFAYGTVIGAVIGLLFGPFGVVACGIAGGVLGATRNCTMPEEGTPRHPRQIMDENRTTSK